MDQNIPQKFRLEFFGYRLLEKMVLAIPDPALPAVARFLAFLVFYVVRIRRRVSLDNLKIAFPDKNYSWQLRTAYFSYLHFALVILEFMKMQRWSEIRLGNRVRILDKDRLIDFVKRGSGVIIASGHFGNWETGMAFFHVKGLKSAVIQQRQKNILINQKMKSLREKWGMEIMEPRGAVQKAARKLNKGKIIGLLADQDAGDRGIFVPFFIRQASTHVGAAVLHLKTGKPLFLATAARSNTNQINLVLTKLPDFSKTGQTPENVYELNRLLMWYLEREIRKYPEQYFWMHRRWKTSPPLVAEYSK